MIWRKNQHMDETVKSRQSALFTLPLLGNLNQQGLEVCSGVFHPHHTGPVVLCGGFGLSSCPGVKLDAELLSHFHMS